MWNCPRACETLLQLMACCLATTIHHLNQCSRSNGLSPVWRQAITRTSADLLSTGPITTDFSEIWIEIQNFSFMKGHLVSLFVHAGTVSTPNRYRLVQYLPVQLPGIFFFASFQIEMIWTCNFDYEIFFLCQIISFQNRKFQMKEKTETLQTKRSI